MTDGGQAFPLYLGLHSKDVPPPFFKGMSLRDYFAALAMAAVLNRESIAELETEDGYTADQCAQDAYIYADAMIKHRTKGAT